MLTLCLFEAKSANCVMLSLSLSMLAVVHVMMSLIHGCLFRSNLDLGLGHI